MKPGKRRQPHKSRPEEAAEKRKGVGTGEVEHPFLYLNGA